MTQRIRGSSRLHSREAAGGLALLVAICTWGCASTFLVYKDCRSGYFGSGGPWLHKTLCPSGDLAKILADTGFPEETKVALLSAGCNEGAGERVKQLYRMLTPDQKRDLKSAFVRNGYEINVKPVPNFRPLYGYGSVYGSNPDFCPPETSY